MVLAHRWRWLLVLALGSCRSDGGAHTARASATASSSPSASSSAAPAPAPLAARFGATTTLIGENAIVVAGEDHAVLWQIALPLTASSQASRVALPGAPAQVLALGDRVLVTVRNPGLLLSLRREGAELREEARVPLPDDAWGLAVTADRQTALVTSAWAHQLSAIDLLTWKVRWQLDVAREPRAVVTLVGKDHAYVSHLVGADLTRIDGIASSKPTSKRIALPPARALAPRREAIAASLAYSAVLSPDESRLFVPRHALGALGVHLSLVPTWFGAATVDVLLTANDEPLAPARTTSKHIARARDYVKKENDEDFSDRELLIDAPSHAIDGSEGPLPLNEAAPFAQPRAIAYRRAARTLLVASEGGDELVELDATALEPGRFRHHRYRLGKNRHKLGGWSSGSAPSSVTLSPDEATAYVFCRGSYELLAVPLVGIGEHADEQNPIVVKLADDPLLSGVADNDPKRKSREVAAAGRRLFYSGGDRAMSEDLGCAACHPEGRDDGHVWHEVVIEGFSSPPASFLGSAAQVAHHAAAAPGIGALEPAKGITQGPGRARQTPMLAGRVASLGPYGWLAESKTLGARLKGGFSLHRWSLADETSSHAESRALTLAAFLRLGLVAPVRGDRPLALAEQRGRELFNSNEVGCAACHIPETEYSNRATAKLRLPARAGSADETHAAFKVPSLFFVAGTPPYFHDGSVGTLDDVVIKNAAHMGNTARLSTADQQALIAFLKTL